MASLIRSENSEVRWQNFAAKIAEGSRLRREIFCRRNAPRDLGVVFFTDRVASVISGLLSFLTYYGASRLQPAGRVGPYAALTKTLLFRYQIAV